MNLIVHIDGGSRGNPGPAAAGVVIHDADGVPLLEAGYFLGRLTNNQAEYRALLRALDSLQQLEVDDVTIFSDSELMVRQITGVYRVKSADLKPLHAQAQRSLLGLSSWQIRHVMREENKRADQLANRAMDHKSDVVEVELLGSAKPSPKSNPPAPARRTQPTASESPMPSVVAAVTVASDPGVCSAPCKKGCEYAFNATVPPELCVNAAHTLLKTVLALQHVPPSDDHEPAAPMTLRCIRADCNAVFEVRCRR